MNKYITGIIIGACVTVTVLSVWYLYNMNNRVVQLELFATQVTNIINNSKDK